MRVLEIILPVIVLLLLSFGMGFVLKPFMEDKYRKYLPFMVSVYEGGLMAYPLYTSLCGQENLSQIAVLDIAGLLFGFSIYMGMLGQVENGEKVNVKQLCMSALRTPAFIASVLGIVAGLSKVVVRLINSPFGGTYLAIGNKMLLSLAIITYMSAPATFSMQTFLKKEEGSAYVSTTNSMYCMVSILVYVILAAVVY